MFIEGGQSPEGLYARGCAHDEPVARTRWDGSYQSYASHVDGVTRLVDSFPKPSWMKNLGRNFGRFHDVGKLDPEWQACVRPSAKDEEGPSA